MNEEGKAFNSRPRKIRIGMRNMSEPMREVMLSTPRIAMPFVKYLDWEKNWTPFLHEGTVLLSYRLQPHVVIRCNWTNGVCNEAYRTDSPYVWEHHNTSARMGARGGPP